ncbi:hypothetical protein GCM10027186_57780 [Micromonospora schwarzwaldensis]
MPRRTASISTSGSVISTPLTQIRRFCAFLDFPYHPRLHAHSAPRESHGPAGDRRLPIDRRVRALCDELTERLDRAVADTRSETEAADRG